MADHDIPSVSAVDEIEQSLADYKLAEPDNIDSVKNELWQAIREVGIAADEGLIMFREGAAWRSFLRLLMLVSEFSKPDSDLQ